MLTHRALLDRWPCVPRPSLARIDGPAAGRLVTTLVDATRLLRGQPDPVAHAIIGAAVVAAVAAFAAESRATGVALETVLVHVNAALVPHAHALGRILAADVLSAALLPGVLAGYAGEDGRGSVRRAVDGSAPVYTASPLCAGLVV